MSIQHIQGLSAYEMSKTPRLQRPQPAASMPPKTLQKDTYESTANFEKEDRSKLLDSVKKRIKSGYYSSDEVVEDLSDSFANIFNKSL